MHKNKKAVEMPYFSIPSIGLPIEREYNPSWRTKLNDFWKNWWPSILFPALIAICYYMITEKNIDKAENRLNERIVTTKQEVLSAFEKDKYQLNLEIEKLKLIDRANYKVKRGE